MRYFGKITVRLLKKTIGSFHSYSGGYSTDFGWVHLFGVCYFNLLLAV